VSTYHDLEFQIGDEPRRKLSDEPFAFQITCTRAAGWELWVHGRHMAVVAGEFHTVPLRLYVAGVQICDPEEKPHGSL
jgi:hypothetical protein